MNEINLTPAQVIIAASAGVLRQAENLKLGREPAHGAGALNNWQIHIEGALGEYALSKFLNIYWPGKGQLRAPDVGLVDVRTATRPDSRLILHPDDPDDRQFWLLTGVNGRYMVRGWCWGRDGKKQKFWTDPTGGRPAFFVPQSALVQRDLAA